MASATVTVSASVLDVSFVRAASPSAAGALTKDPSLAAAPASGTLTTRTSNTAGTLTLQTGHGIITAARMDLYWIDAMTGLTAVRYGCTVGTVSGNSVPFTVGAGTNLPAANFAVTAVVPTQETFPAVYSALVGLFVTCVKPCQAIFLDGSNAVVAAILTQGSALRDGYVWESTNGVTNPFGTSTVATVWMSHSDTANARQVIATALLN